MINHLWMHATTTTTTTRLCFGTTKGLQMMICRPRSQNHHCRRACRRLGSLAACCSCVRCGAVVIATVLSPFWRVELLGAASCVVAAAAAAAGWLAGSLSDVVCALLRCLRVVVCVRVCVARGWMLCAVWAGVVGDQQQQQRRR